MYYDEDSNTNFNASSAANIGKARETLTYAEAQRMIEVEIEGVIHRININEPMNIIALDPESNKSDKLALERYQTPEIYSNHSEHTFVNSNHVSSSSNLSSKKATKKGRSTTKTKESSMKSSKTNVNSSSSANNPQQIKIPEPSFRVINNLKQIDVPSRPISYYRYIDRSSEELDETVEYDMDEEGKEKLEFIFIYIWSCKERVYVPSDSRP